MFKFNKAVFFVFFFLLTVSVRAQDKENQDEPIKLKSDLVTSHVVNWTTDPFTLGSYAYDTLESAKARDVLIHP